jgi:predicted enzyme related to lactoylglutathione lyase
MPLDLFAGICVRNYEAAKAWYMRLLGSEPTFIASDTEAVWELAEHRSLFIEQNAEHAGHAVQTIFVDDLDALVAQIAGRGIEPVKRETYPNGVRKALYRDPDGNEIGFGGALSSRILEGDLPAGALLWPAAIDDHLVLPTTRIRRWPFLRDHTLPARSRVRLEYQAGARSPGGLATGCRWARRVRLRLRRSPGQAAAPGLRCGGVATSRPSGPRCSRQPPSWTAR